MRQKFKQWMASHQHRWNKVGVWIEAVLRWVARRLSWMPKAAVAGIAGGLVLLAASQRVGEPADPLTQVAYARSAAPVSDSAAYVAVMPSPAAVVSAGDDIPTLGPDQWCPNGTYPREGTKGTYCVDAKGVVHEPEGTPGKIDLEPTEPPISTNDPDALPPEVYVVESCKGAAASHRLSVEIVGNAPAFDFTRKDCGDATEGQTVSKGGGLVWRPDAVHRRATESTTFFRPAQSGEVPHWTTPAAEEAGSLTLDDGGWAFPHSYVQDEPDENKPGSTVRMRYQPSGLTKREYFAGQAMVGIAHESGVRRRVVSRSRATGRHTSRRLDPRATAASRPSQRTRMNDVIVIAIVRCLEWLRVVCPSWLAQRYLAACWRRWGDD